MGLELNKEILEEAFELQFTVEKKRLHDEIEEESLIEQSVQGRESGGWDANVRSGIHQRRGSPIEITSSLCL